MKSSLATVLVTALFGLVVISKPSFAQEDLVLYRFVADKPIQNGDFGPIKRFQVAFAERVASSCSVGDVEFSADGVFGRQTHDAIKALLLCYPEGPSMPSGSAAFDGVITEALWQLVTSEPPPSAVQRAGDLTLAYEATDYTALEWNFCQSQNPAPPRLTFKSGDPQCYSNDPCSFATWGPRGATAGHGREIQAILFAVDRANSKLLEESFRNEFSEVRRLLEADRVSTERMLCAIWNDKLRSAAWVDGFWRLGKHQRVQEEYQRIYASVDYDGAKMRNFYRVYEGLQRDPTEVDYAFFLDRATHGGFPRSAQIDGVVREIQDFIRSAGREVNAAEIRWKLASLLPTANQKEDRLGRDVVFVIDTMRSKLSVSDLQAWQKRGPFRASDFGLSDQRTIPSFQPGPSIGYKDQKLRDVESSQDNKCPAVAIAPLHPRSGKTIICNK